MSVTVDYMATGDPGVASTIRKRISPYIKIARPDHWFKNIFMLPGMALAFALGLTVPFSAIWLWPIGVFSVCLVASANYTINEWLDCDSDRHHPIKKDRPSVQGQIKPECVYLQWAVLSLAGLALAWSINVDFFITSVVLLFMGVLYNVEPARLKDAQYFDVLSESVNNPLRFLLGWFLIGAPVLPPSSVLLSYWMGGAFLMAVKRFAEYRYIGDPDRAALYRKSFAKYSEESLFLSAFFYALMSAVFLGVFLVKYKIEFLLSLPLFAVLFVWYLHLGMQPHSVSQTPEKLYRQKGYFLFTILLSVVVMVLFFIDIPWLHVFVESIVTLG